MFLNKKIGFFILFFLSLNPACSQTPHFDHHSKIKVEYVVDSFDDETIESTILSSELESIIQSADSVYFGSTTECECECAGGNLLFYFSDEKKAPANFYTGALYDRLCSPLNNKINLIWKFKDSSRLNAIIKALKK